MLNTSKVRRIGLLSKLSAHEMNALLAGAKHLTFTSGDEILAQGAVNGSLYLIEQGVLHARRTGGRRSVLLARLEPGSFFGEMSLFDAAPTSASIQAISDGALVQITRNCLNEFIDQHPKAGAELLRKILQGIARRLRMADDRVTNALLFGGVSTPRSSGKDDR